jgi:hypothetical protein
MKKGEMFVISESFLAILWILFINRTGKKPPGNDKLCNSISLCTKNTKNMTTILPFCHFSISILI